MHHAVVWNLRFFMQIAKRLQHIIVQFHTAVQKIWLSPLSFSSSSASVTVAMNHLSGNVIQWWTGAVERHLITSTTLEGHIKDLQN